MSTLTRILKPFLVVVLLGLLVGALGGWVAARAFHIPQVDQLEGFAPAATTHILAADGQVVDSFARERRHVLKPHEIPDVLKLAIVAAEDAEFYSHGGVDPKAILRAALGSLKEGRLGAKGGGSTLTQQLALNLFLQREHTIQRKIKEALLAINLEKELSKDQILALYSNLIFLGHGAYGVEAASRLYFGRSARELELPEAALLAGIIQAPNRHSPIRNPDNAENRRRYVLRRMREVGFITAAEERQAAAAPLLTRLHREKIPTGAYYVETVRRDLAERLGDDAVYEQGLEVQTAMVPELQLAAERAIRRGLVELDMSLGFRDPTNVVREGLVDDAAAYRDPTWNELELNAGMDVLAVVTAIEPEVEVSFASRFAAVDPSSVEWTGAGSASKILEVGDLVLVRLPDPLPDPTDDAESRQETDDETWSVALVQEPALEGALVALDNRSGEVMALVGGFDYARNEFNRATQALRQCGSAFKPFVFLTAYQQGFTPADTLLDAPFLVEMGPEQPPYCPKNYYPKYFGVTTLRRALEKSYNAASVKLQLLVGGESVVDTARRFGISSEMHPYPSLALGSFEVRLLDLVQAYAGIANLGEVPEPILVREIRDREGRVQERQLGSMHRAMSAPASYLMVETLKGVIQRGTGTAARHLGGHLAGKTGTTDDYTDAWFVGFSPSITVGVWVGRDLKEPIGRRMTGARAALPVWIDFMESYRAFAGDDVFDEDFAVPPGVVFSTVDPFTGLRNIRSCNPVILEAFLDGTEPTRSCSDEWHRLEEAPWPMQATRYELRPDEPAPTREALEVADLRLAGRDAD